MSVCDDLAVRSQFGSFQLDAYGVVPGVAA
jgi:hypothetical protein